MIDTGKQLINIVFDALSAVFSEAGAEIDFTPDSIIPGIPPKPELGDVAFPMFVYAKKLRCAPPKIASDVAAKIQGQPGLQVLTAGPYVNFKIDRKAVAEQTLTAVLSKGDSYGRTDSLKGKRIMVEFSCPNTNKPLHLGHLRNDSYGESVSRIFAANGAEVKKVNLINDRGIHICKSMAAYQKFGAGTTPESEHIKGDHFVGDYYVKYNTWSQTDETAEPIARDMLVKWEAGDQATVELWKLMNKWTIDGIFQTYRKTGISFDKIYYESQTYKSGKEIILEGLEKGLFYKNDKGAICVDLAEINLDTKVLLRGDGTSVYITQDIGTAIARHKDWPFDALFYVVGSEQQYHFKVLFYVLQKLGFDWAKDLHHLSYGMVNLPEGKMKSREGKVVDADDLIDELEKMAREEIIAKGRESEISDVDKAAESIALGALNYFLLSTIPTKDMVFNPKESLSFNGNTGPYLQYTGARICTMLGKYEGSTDGVDYSLAISDDEWEIIKLIGNFGETVKQAGAEYNPMLIAGYLYNLAKHYSKYYHDCPILKSEPEVAKARVVLSKAVLQVLKNGFALIGIPFLEAM